jgi:hypothetical protein
LTDIDQPSSSPPEAWSPAIEAADWRASPLTDAAAARGRVGDASHVPVILQSHPARLPPAWPRPEGKVAVRGGERFDWGELVPLIVHPLKVTIIEAIDWIDEPLSASDLTKVIDRKKFGLSHVSYHLNQLGKVGALKVVRRRRVRGSVEKFYFFR